MGANGRVVSTEVEVGWGGCSVIDTHYTFANDPGPK